MIEIEYDDDVLEIMQKVNRDLHECGIGVQYRALPSGDITAEATTTEVLTLIENAECIDPWAGQ